MTPLPLLYLCKAVDVVVVRFHLPSAPAGRLICSTDYFEAYRTIYLPTWKEIDLETFKDWFDHLLLIPTYLPGWHVHFKYSWPVDSCFFPRRLVASACYNSKYVFLWFKWALGRQKITENWQLYSYYTILLVISRDHNTFLKYGQIPASFWSHLPWATDKKVSRLLVWILVRNF